MNHPILHTSKAILKKTSDEISKPGDYCIVKKLPVAGNRIPPHQALIIKCPACRMDIATSGAIKINQPGKLAVWIYTLFGIPHGVTLDRVLQCPYGPHSFHIKKGQITVLQKDGETRPQKINQRT